MSARETTRGAGQLLVDLGPIIVFVLCFNLLKGERFGFVHDWLGTGPDDAIFIATAAFIVATLLAAGYAWLKTRKVPPVVLVTAVLVVVFGGLTLAFRDEQFIKIKPTIVNLFYASAIFGSMLFGVNVWRMLFSHAFTLPERIWRVLAVRWGLFVIFMAVVNEVLWRTTSTDFWVQSRLFITFPLVILFALANVPITMKHAGQTDDPDPAQSAADVAEQPKAPS